MTEKKTVVGTLNEMQIGEVVEYPPERYRYITSTCSDFGFISGKKFKVTKNREKRVVEVKRVS